MGKYVLEWRQVIRGESEENVVCKFFEPEKVIRGSSSESTISVVSDPKATWQMKRLSP